MVDGLWSVLHRANIHVFASWANQSIIRLMREGAVAVVFDDQKDNVLFVNRRDVPIWVLPGGGIDPGESPDVAAVREVFEESGLEVRVVRKVAVYTPTGKLTSETHLFECCVVGGQGAG